MRSKLIILLSLVICGNGLAYGYTFGEYADDVGLTGNETNISAEAEITDLPGLANNYPALQDLFLYGNEITSIESGDFAGLGNLLYLDLGWNRITSIESGSFDELGNLISLQIYDNQITSIESGDFAGMGNLDYLSLYDNQITSIESGSFDELGNLNYLTLYDNQITSIESGDFAGLGNLEVLKLSGNQITSIENGSFAGLGNLRELSVGGNQITSIESGSFAGLTNLRELAMSGNQITSIESGDFAGLGNLENLSLGGNQIETMDLSNLDLSSLASFNLSSNPLTSMVLSDTTLSQGAFDAFMDGGIYSWLTGIAEISGVLELDMSGVDFSGISDLSRMYTMDDLEDLLLIDAINLAGSDVSQLTIELASLDLLNVTGLWDTFDVTSQNSLNAWDAIEGNSLVVPEPATILLFGFGGLLLRRRRA